MAEAQQTISADKLCALTGLTDRRHRQLAKDGFFPSPEDGMYLLVPTLQGLFRHYRQMNESRGATADEKLGKIAAERKLAELQLAREKREVLPADDVERAWSFVCSTVRGRWLQIPAKAELAFPLWADARVCSNWLEEMIHAILKELAESPDYTPEEAPADDAQPSNQAA